MNIAPEFNTVKVTPEGVAAMREIRTNFTNLLNSLEFLRVAGNERYFSIVKTKLEEAGMFAIKAASLKFEDSSPA